MGPSEDPEAFQVHGRDLVEQLLYGFGWRITGQHEGPETRSLLLSTVDPSGVRFVVTCDRAADATAAPQPAASEPAAEPFEHFSRTPLQRYFANHNDAQGIAVLGFETSAGELDAVHSRYAVLHPRMLGPSPGISDLL